jgi:probable HAF family extracellular repeat protein
MSSRTRRRPFARAVALAAFCILATACGGGGGNAKNTPPVASFVATPTSGLSPLAVALDASGSTDREGPIAAFSWNFGDGSATATGATTTHVYQAAGSFTVVLTVTDGKGLTGTANRTITVITNTPPTAAFTATPTSGTAPLTVALDASGSRDPDGTIAGYEWTFGDGKTGTGQTAQHIYVDAGSFQVTLKVTDDRGAVGTALQTVTVTPAATAAAWYSVTEIPSLGGWYVEPSSIANGITGKGYFATGYSYFDATDVAHAFSFNGSSTHDIGTLGGKTSYGKDVNDYGEVVGNSDNAQGFVRAFQWSPYGMKDLGTLGGLTSEAAGINNANQIVGRSADKDGFARAFLYENGQMRSLGTLGGDWSQASAINGNGAVAGASTTAKGERHAFIYSGGVMTDVSGVAIDSVRGINDANDVIGMWAPGQGYAGLTGFLYRGGVMQSLVPGYSEPTAINNAGIVVGNAHFGQNGRAFVWDKTKGLQDLNSLIDPTLGWTLQVADGINDQGHIVAHGYRAGGASVAVVLTPAAKPIP